MHSGVKLKTSTPLQSRYDSGFGSFENVSNVLPNEIIELSPVRKQSSLRCNFSAVLKVCRNFKNWNKPVDKISKKLFISSDINNSDSATVNNDNDSGISVSSKSENLKAFSSDENCNSILSSFYKTDSYQPYKYICTEDKTKIIREELKPSSREKSIYLFKLLGDDVSTDVFSDNIQNTVLKCDLLHELYIRNCTSILSDILSYLSGNELRVLSNVSKQWQNIVFNDKTANERRKIYIENRKNTANGPNKENRYQFLPPAGTGRDHKSAFTSVINTKIESLQPSKFPSLNGRFDSFIQEVERLKDKETLKKCPKCNYPSKAQSENKFCCTRKLCQHEFCEKCLGPYLNNHICSIPELKDGFRNLTVGSKKSKKNLKRL